MAKLCDLGERRAATAIRKLGQLGLLHWDPSGRSITFPNLAAPGDSAATPLDDALPGRSGMATLPRRMVRFLARGARPALIATTLGVLLRCVSRRRAGWGPRGRVKASWIAEVFDVDVRRVKAARAELARLGWLRADEEADPQWAWNRWGRAFVVNLAWSRPKPAGIPASTPGADCHPVPPPRPHDLPPPDLHLDPVPEKKNPDPGFARPDGINIRQQASGSRREVEAYETSGKVIENEESVGIQPRKNHRAACLNQIQPKDLVEMDRTLALYAAAVQAGWSSRAEVDRLRFVAAAIHARGVGATNPAGLFRAIVQGQWWHLITQAEEDRARAGLRLHDQGPSTVTSRQSGRSESTAIHPLATLLERFAPRLTGSAAASPRPANRSLGQHVS